MYLCISFLFSGTFVYIKFPFMEHPYSSLDFSYLPYFDNWKKILSLHLFFGTWYIAPLQEGMIVILNKAPTIFVDWVLHMNKLQCHPYSLAFWFFHFLSLFFKTSYFYVFPLSNPYGPWAWVPHYLHQIAQIQNMCYIYSPRLWDFIECFEELITVNKLRRLCGYYPRLFVIIQYFNHLLECFFWWGALTSVDRRGDAYWEEIGTLIYTVVTSSWTYTCWWT